MRAARASLLLAAAVLLASALHLSFALPADMPAEAEAAAAAVRDPEEYPAAEKPEKPESPGYHFPTIPRPSEIIHAVGNYVHGGNNHQAEQVEEHEHHHRPPTTHRPPLHHREKPKIKVTKTVLVEVRLRSFPLAAPELPRSFLLCAPPTDSLISFSSRLILAEPTPPTWPRP